MKYYVLTCDRLVDKTCEMVDWNFQKFWPEIEVVVLGYSTPKYKPQHSKFISLGKDLGVGSVCTQVSSFFETSDDDYFVLGVDDTPLICNVNHDSFLKLLDVIKSDKKIGRLGLTKDNYRRKHNVLYKVGDMDVFINEHDTEYRLSLATSLWNKKFFLEYGKKSSSLWDFELKGSEISKESDWKISGSNPWLLDNGHIYKRGKVIESWYKGIYTGVEFSKEDISFLKNLYDL